MTHRVAVIGAGAVGSPVAAFMARAGVSVQLAEKRPEVREMIGQRGLVLTGARGRHLVRLPAVGTIDELAGPLDVVFLAVKTFDTAEVIRQVKAKLSAVGFLVTLQNGLTLDEVASVVGPDRVLGCVVGWGATVIEPGHVEVTVKGDFMLGEPDGSVTPRVQAVKELLGHTYSVKLVEDIRGALFSKVIVNSCVTTLGAVTGLTLGQLLTHRRARQVFLAVATEGLRVAQAAKVRLYPAASGWLRLQTLSLDTGYGRASGLDLWRKHALLRLGAPWYRQLKSSMLQSLERNERTEVDAINGLIVSKGEKYGVSTPVNKALVDIVHELEARLRVSSLRNLDDPRLAEAGT